MKLKQALVFSLTTAVLAVPAFASDETKTLPTSNVEQKASIKKGVHTKGHKHCSTAERSEVKKTEQSADINKLNSALSDSDTTN